MRGNKATLYKMAAIGAMALGGVLNVSGQVTLEAERDFIQRSSDRMWLAIGLIILTTIAAAAALLWVRSRRGAATGTAETKAGFLSPGAHYLEREMQRDSQKTHQPPQPVQETPKSEPVVALTEEESLEAKMFQEKMRRAQYAQLPINAFHQLAPAKGFRPLEVSDDPALVTAIEQANEEFEEDEAVRELALRILAAFKTQNSIEALSQIAIYDLSSTLRAKAVTTLAEFDHETVFETVLLACADPTREVRAAAARGLFKLSFDRSHAWKRIIDSEDVYRMSAIARAAIEAGIVIPSFDRLINEDVKVAYEAFALMSLLVAAGETDVLFDAIRDHKDERLKFALLHVIKVSKDERALARLNQLRIENSFPSDVAERMRDVVKSFETVTA